MFNFEQFLFQLYYQKITINHVKQPGNVTKALSLPGLIEILDSIPFCPIFVSSKRFRFHKKFAFRVACRLCTPILRGRCLPKCKFCQSELRKFAESASSVEMVGQICRVVTKRTQTTQMRSCCKPALFIANTKAKHQAKYVLNIPLAPEFEKPDIS